MTFLKLRKLHLSLFFLEPLTLSAYNLNSLLALTPEALVRMLKFFHG